MPEVGTSLQKSKWFTRGWTLQEVLAPLSVTFYSKKGEPLGDKQSLRDTIHETTGISVKALSVQLQRSSWARNRQTAREEDKAYFLRGIFGVHLPLIYSEGEENAFDRLRDAVATKENEGERRRTKENKGEQRRTKAAAKTKKKGLAKSTAGFRSLAHPPTTIKRTRVSLRSFKDLENFLPHCWADRQEENLSAGITHAQQYSRSAASVMYRNLG